MSDEELGSGSGSESGEESSAPSMPEMEVATAGATGKAARPPANHPSTLDMVVEAIEAISDSKGASVQAIKQWIPARYPTVDPARLGSLVKKALAKGLETGRLVRPKKSEGLTGATGRFKVGKPPKPEKKPAKKKPAAKKAKPKKEVNFENGDDASSESSPEENGVYDYPDEASGSDEEDSPPPSPPPKKKAVAKAKKPATKAKKSPKEKASAKKTKAAAEKPKTKAAAKEPKANGTSKPKSKTKAAAEKETTAKAKKSPKKTAAKPKGRPKKVVADSD